MDPSDLLSMSLDDILKQKRDEIQVKKLKPKPKSSQALIKKVERRRPLLRKSKPSRPFDLMEGRSDVVPRWEHDRHEESYKKADDGAAFKRQEGGRRARNKANIAASGIGKTSIHSRLGSPPGNKKIFGIRVSFSNLNDDVDIDDIKEVAKTAGQVNHVEMENDRAGLSTGRALVTYARFLDAQQAVETLNLRTLDGTPMQVKLVGSVGGARGLPEAAGRAQINTDFRTAKMRSKSSVQPKTRYAKDVPIGKFSAMTLEREGALKTSNSVMKGRGFQASNETLERRDDFWPKTSRGNRGKRPTGNVRMQQATDNGNLAKNKG